MKKSLVITKKQSYIIASVLVLTVVLSAIFAVSKQKPKINKYGENQILETNAEITNWGLSFQEEGKCPVANASTEFLADYNSFFVGDTTKKTIYITFDAGYENGNTQDILDALKKHNVTATFFLVGNYLETQPELVKQMAENGHNVANHTWSHPDMSKISDKESFTKEIKDVEDKYFEITGQEMVKLYRPPQGKFSVDNLEMAKELGYNTVFWSLAYVDWYADNQPTKQEAFDKLLPRIHPGSVVLLHSTSSTNAEIMDELLTKWEEMGYTFGNILELCK